MLLENDKFISLVYKESKKSRFDGNKLRTDLGNWGGDIGSRYFVDRNGEYTGIVIQLEEKMYPLYLTNSVHQIYLNIESGYTNNLMLIEKFNLVNLFHKYSNQIFRFIVDEFLLSNNLEPFYLDYKEILKKESMDKELIELKKKIKYDYHELIPVPIQVISCGSLLPEDWIYKKFDNGINFHQQIDKLDERIGKPPVTYLANYTMTKLKILKPELYNIDAVKKIISECKKNKLVFILDTDLKFVQDYIDGEFKYLKKNIDYSIINLDLENLYANTNANTNIDLQLIILFNPDMIMLDKIESKQVSIGLDYCINDVLTMLKSSITNLKNSNTKKSKLRYIKKTKKSKIFKVENFGSITTNSFFTSKLGKYLHSNPNVNYKKSNSSLSTIQFKNGKFYMLVKKKINY